MERANCSCAICKLEQTLLLELQQAQHIEFFREIAAHHPILAGFPASLEPLARMRRSPVNHAPADSSDAFLGELLRPASGEKQKLHRSILLLLLVPSLHKTTRQIAAGFPLLARDDIAQHLIVTVLQILESSSLEEQKSHFAFSIIRLLRRQSFRWAIHETRHAIEPQAEVADIPAPATEASGGVEARVFLREVLQNCLSRGLLSEKEHELLVTFKIDGLSSQLLSAHEGLSGVALRHRVQRIIDRLRRQVQAPPPKKASASAKRLPTSCSTPGADRVA
jgi:DNA-directed RNA polymerase specialized sigma24 family protein